MVLPGQVEWDRVREAGAEVLRKNKREELTWGEFKRKLASALDIDVLLLKDHKSALHDLIQAANEEGSEGEEDEENESEGEEEEQESDGMIAMRALARAMNLGPKPLVGLKQMKMKEAERTLKDRLIEAGAKFRGPFPSAREIAQARRKTETAKDLDGIDLSNVVAGARRRRGSGDENVSPPKKQRLVQGQDGVSDSECSGDENGSDEDSEEEFQLSG